jgi:hypothetical protein
MRRLLFLLSLWWLAAGAATAQTAYPALGAPAGARVVVVAPDVVLNGQRSRILQIDSRGGADALIAHYREQFGARRVENKLSDAQIVAARVGSFFHTVQVRRQGPEGARATIITTAVASMPSHSAAMKETQSWLPADSATQQTMESTDGGLRSITVAASNTHSVQGNRDLLLQTMTQRGLRLDNENKGDTPAAAGREAVALSLSSRDENVLLTVSDTGERRAVLIIRTRQTPP